MENDPNGRSLLSRSLPWILLIGLFVTYNLNGRFIGGSDVFSTRFMPIILAKTGSYYFDESGVGRWNLGTMVQDPASPSNGKYISVYPTYMPTLLSPLYYIFYGKMGLDLPIEHFLAFYLDKWISSFIAALTGVLVFSLVRRMHGGRNAMAMLVTLGMSLGTSLWAISSQGSWAMGPSAFFLILAVWSLERAVRHRDHPQVFRWAWLAGFAIASAFAMRLSNMIFVLPFFLFGLWELRRQPKAMLLLFLGVFPVAAWFCIHNYLYFGSPLKTGYNYNLTQLRVPNLMHIENFFAGFIGLLFSPSLGMFMTGPVTLFAFPGLLGALFVGKRLLERRGDGTLVFARRSRNFMQRILLLIAPFVVFHILFYSCYLEWWGGWSYCYRYLIDIQPFLFLGVGWFFRPKTRFRMFRWPMFIPALALSLLVQSYGAFIWGGRLMKLNPMPRFYLNLDPNKGHKGPFNEPFWFYSFKREDHLMLGELSQIPPMHTFIDAFGSPKEIKKDLFETQRWGPERGHIIIYYGR